MTTGYILVQTLHLGNSQCGLQFGHPVVEAEIDLLIVPGAVSLVGHLRRVAGDAVAAQ
ncbi:hypothetical protein D3C85_1936030 [compost metagenome]